MIFLLDTNTVSDLMRKQPSRRHRLAGSWRLDGMVMRGDLRDERI
jgi:hypothetical protein